MFYLLGLVLFCANCEMEDGVIKIGPSKPKIPEVQDLELQRVQLPGFVIHMVKNPKICFIHESSQTYGKGLQVLDDPQCDRVFKTYWKGRLE